MPVKGRLLRRMPSAARAALAPRRAASRLTSSRRSRSPTSQAAGSTSASSTARTSSCRASRSGSRNRPNVRLRSVSLNVHFKKIVDPSKPGLDGEQEFDEVFLQTVEFAEGTANGADDRPPDRPACTGDPPQTRAEMLAAPAVPGRPRARLRQAELDDVGRACWPSTFRARSLRSSVSVSHSHSEYTVPTQTAAALSTPPAEPQVLARRLGPLDAAAIIVSNVIGGGILFTPPLVAASVPESVAVPGDVGRRRRARVRRRDGLRRARGAAAARRRRVRLPARRVRTARGVPDRLDVVRRRVLRRDRGQRRRARVLRRTLRPGRRTTRRRSSSSRCRSCR